MKTSKPLHLRIIFVITHPKVYIMLLFYYIKCKNEKFRGLDFTENRSGVDLNLPRDRSWGYATASNIYLNPVFRRFKITGNDKIVDIGSGKGYALLKFRKYPFSKIAGIELSKELYDISKKNLEKLEINNIELYNMDASKFDHYDAFNYYYFYNPFLDCVMQEVIDKIKESLIKKPRKVVIIYRNPMCHDVIINSGIFIKTCEFKTEYKKFNIFIYEN